MIKNNNYILPDIEECRSLMKDMMLPNIIMHSEKVMQVALVLAENTITNNALDINLITASALLHDITKTRAINTGERHDITGGEFLRSLGYEKVAEVIEEHVLLHSFDHETEINEKEIVFYADKRVLHTRIVTIDERIEDILIRYGKTEEIKARIRKNMGTIRKVENKIKKKIRPEVENDLLMLNNSGSF